MSKKQKEEVIIPVTVEESYISISTFFKTKDLLKDSSNLNTKLNIENHYFSDVHRLDPEGPLPFYYVVHFENKQYKGGPYKTIYDANRACAAKLYELYNLDETPIIECEIKKLKPQESEASNEDKD